MFGIAKIILRIDPERTLNVISVLIVIVIYREQIWYGSGTNFEHRLKYNTANGYKFFNLTITS